MFKINCHDPLNRVIVLTFIYRPTIE